MRPALDCMLGAALLAACTSTSRSPKPATPITYTLPEYRALRSVGNLRRLAVLPTRFDRRQGKEEDARAAARQYAEQVASCLRDQKGYEIVMVGDERTRWRGDVVAKPALGPADALQALWDGARNAREVAAAVQRIGRALDVDGVVAGWIEYDARASDASVGMGAAWGIMNIFLLNGPLMYEIFHDRARVEIYETASGRQVWRASGTADFGPAGPPSVAKLLDSLENAIPARLTN